MESIEVVTSITNANVYEDGSITPTLATVVGTSLFENGVLAATVQQDPGHLQSGNFNSTIDISKNGTSTTSTTAGILQALLAPGQAAVSVPSTSNVSSRSVSPNPGAAEQQQEQQQQQRQRELHYESANAVLVPPLNFALVAPGVYRSGHPNKHNFPFMKKLGLKVIVQMSEEPYAPDLVEFLEQEKIRRIHYTIEGNKHRIGCLIGCLRKIQNWSMTSIFDEYRRFAGSKVLADQEFIEIFPAKVPYLLEHKPVWL
ncbi:MAG: tyrosine phosphatase family-domain-containing protein [Linnemannia gamsii]|nr:MAG: tyrosine phosphatase family-domain-containing protein [Linnemannia gamsii]